MKNKVARPLKSAGPKMDRYSDLLRRTVRHVRKRMKISQAELAKLAGIEQSSLSKFEKGTRNLSAEAQEQLKAALEQAKSYQKADAANNWGWNFLGGPAFAFGIPREPLPAPRMSKKLLKEEEALDKEIAGYGTAKLSPEDAAKLPQAYMDLVEAHNNLRASVEEQNRKFADMTAKGYALFLSKEVEAKDRRIAELEEEIRTLKGQQQ